MSVCAVVSGRGEVTFFLLFFQLEMAASPADEMGER